MLILLLLLYYAAREKKNAALAPSAASGKHSRRCAEDSRPRTEKSRESKKTGKLPCLPRIN